MADYSIKKALFNKKATPKVWLKCHEKKQNIYTRIN